MDNMCDVVPHGVPSVCPADVSCWFSHSTCVFVCEWAFNSSTIFVFLFVPLCVCVCKHAIISQGNELSKNKLFKHAVGSVGDTVLELPQSWTRWLFPFPLWGFCNGTLNDISESAVNWLKCLFLLHSGGNKVEWIRVCILLEWTLCYSSYWTGVRPTVESG